MEIVMLVALLAASLFFLYKSYNSVKFKDIANYSTLSILFSWMFWNYCWITEALYPWALIGTACVIVSMLTFIFKTIEVVAR